MPHKELNKQVFTNEELNVMAEGILIMIDDANKSKKLLHADGKLAEMIDAKIREMQNLLVKIGKCQQQHF